MGETKRKYTRVLNENVYMMYKLLQLSVVILWLQNILLTFLDTCYLQFHIASYNADNTFSQRNIVA